MAYGAERVAAMGNLPLENVQLIENTNIAILDIPAHLSKTGNAHPSIIPKELAERLLEAAQSNGYNTLLPNHKSLWAKITKLALKNYNVNSRATTSESDSKQDAKESPLTLSTQTIGLS